MDIAGRSLLSPSRALIAATALVLATATAGAQQTYGAPPLPDNPEAMFAEGQRKFVAGQWNDARRVFDAFVNRYPSDQRASKAQFLIGDAYFSEGKFANAIGATHMVVEPWLFSFSNATILPAHRERTEALRRDLERIGAIAAGRGAGDESRTRVLSLGS